MGCCGGNSKKITFGVKGMSCHHCKMAVEKALKELSGVSDAVVNLDEANVTVTYNEGQVTVDQLKDAVRDAGYQPE
ncbi:hypothetical protein BBF96_01760 [Anoxybacter fermentans]|uniref:Copper chaperone CopZ n=1 Tax=Anoxybacter fermentans TaxID=1323375 RepID=A0A3S9SV95_9FIRM|nr:copper ion binding protein [Anoxybacter fermentans]AZR72233.1 hypothetical protein BBF96_01760 [Anoxybacter fermentans]